ncbi:MAG: HDOD domain-containing protein [Anaerolineae bacterium]|nr:HDOD domain-containing protein [Anaerolineae bacterium]
MANTNLIKSVLKSVDGLKPLPSTVTRALKLLEEPDVSIRDIVLVISVDQALTARILSWANSALFGFAHPATTLHEAITRLGFRRTKNILFTLSYSSLLGRRVAGYNLGNGELWRHSVAVGLASQRLSERVAYPAPDEAYVAGLLHDIGKLMLDQFFKVNWDHLLELGQKYNFSLIEAEEYLLGLNHAQVGSELAKKWELPSRLVEAIAYHHAPTFSGAAPKLAAIVQIADHICLRLNLGLPHPDFLPDLSVEGLRLLSLEFEDVDELTELYQDMLSTQLISEESLAPATA